MIYIWVILGIVAGVALISAFVFFNNQVIGTTKNEIEIEGLERDLRIVHLSDLHGKSFGRKNCRLLSKVIKLHPDYILITGDIIHKYTPKNKQVALETASALCSIAPVYYCSGNHEMRNKGYRFFRQQLKEAGVCVLDDCSADMGGLTVVGLNCASLKNDKIFAVTPNNSPKILLAHMPHFIDKYAKAGYDVVFCGHAHGGQWRIPFTRIGLYAPGQGAFPKLISGVHTRGKTRVVISRGLGNSECPLRLFNRPEIVLTILKK